MSSPPPFSRERERQLVDQIQRGDLGALGELLGAYQKRVYHVCLRMVSNRDDAAELTQEALLRAVKHVDSFKKNSRFSTWLIRIAMNLSISHLRKYGRRKTISLDMTVGSEHGGDQASSLKDLMANEREQNPQMSVEKDEQVERLLEALDGLEESLRMVIILRDLQGMDYQQIADVIEVPIGTVKSRLFRARLALRQSMESNQTKLSDNNND